MATLAQRLAGLAAGVGARGLGGPLAAGNASVLDRATGTLVVTPKGVPFGQVDARCAVHVRLGATLEVEAAVGTPSTELSLHLAAYRACPGAEVVLHVHAPWAVAASCLALERLPLVHYHQGLLGAEPTPIVPYATPGSAELAASVGAALATDAGLTAVLLASHGAVVVAPDEREALDLAEALEDVCRLVVLVGDRARPLDAAELPRLRELFRAYRSG